MPDPHTSDDPKRPILMLLTSHWISMLGVALVTTAGFSWLFALPTQLRGHTSNPYIGIVVFIVIPMVFVGGLVLIAAGVFLAHKRIAAGLLEVPKAQGEISVKISKKNVLDWGKSPNLRRVCTGQLTSGASC